MREAGDQEAFVRGQLRDALAGVEERFAPLVTIAYEPLWAIGTGVNADDRTGARHDGLRPHDGALARTRATSACSTAGR